MLNEGRIGNGRIVESIDFGCLILEGKGEPRHR